MADTTPTADRFIDLGNGQRVNYDFAQAPIKAAADAGKYKIVTGATPTPSPAPTTNGTTGDQPSGTLVDRYSKEKANLDSVYGLTTAPDENAIRESKRAAAQAAIDQVNSKYAKIDQADQDTIDLMSRERRASNVLNGLSGSEAGSARTVQTTKDGEKIKNLTAQAHDSEIQAILSNADTRASEEFTKQKSDFIQNAKDKLTAEQTLSDRIKSNALTELQTLATSRGYDELPANLKQQYLSETGMSEDTLKAYFLNAGKASLLSPTPQIMGNKAVWFRQGKDGTISQVSVDLPAGAAKVKDARLTDGGVQVLYEDGTYKVVGTPGNNTDASTNALNLAKVKEINQNIGGGSAQYVMPKASKNNLLKYGFTGTDVSNLESDIRKYGLQKALSGLPDDQQKIIQDELDKTYSVDPSAQ